ncbi:hypothetical protein [Rhodanobacter hydrolyticus]|uniref:Lytic transglycosylase domain-containing protein n=1 Tax=Rhodanobacter hydrolyticus TaxID=2250595 RepID=A0ABW8J481_9GAMM
MATVIDALMITLGFDVTDYKKGQKEVSDAQKKMRDDTTKTLKEMSEGNKKVVEGLTSLKTGLLEVIGIVTGGIGLKDFVLGTMNSQAALGRLSTNLNMNARDLKAWGIVAEEMGGKAQDAYGSLMSIQQGLGEAMANGHSAFTDTARRMGIGITDSMIRNQDYAGVMEAIATRLQSLPRPLAQYDANQLGVGSMFNALMDPNYQQNLAQAQQVVGVTKQSTEAAERLQKQWALVQARFEGIKDKAWAAVEPMIERLVNWLDRVDWDGLAKQINAVVNALGGWGTVATVVGSVLALKLLSPMLGIVGALTRMVPLLGSGAGALSGFGAALSGINLAALGSVLGAVGLLYSPSLGGKQRADGSYEDEAARPGSMPTFSNADLWNRVKGRPSKYTGSALQAATLLAGRMYADKMSPEVYRQAASDILQNKIQPGDFPGGGTASSSAGLPRGVRNDNPGNLNYVGQDGATLEGPGGRFARFSSMDAGISALANQLVLYMARGKDTISSIIGTYAPKGDKNNTAKYINDVMRSMGIRSGDQQLTVADIPKLMRAIIDEEGNGKYVSDADIQSGLRYGARQHAMARANGGNSKSVQNDVHIGQLTVTTQATDAKGMARDLPAQLQNNGMIASIDTGAE